MKIKYILLIILFVYFTFNSQAQESLDSLISVVKQNNKSLKTAKEQNKLKIIESKVGLTPDNPEIELGYLIGKPDEIGNRTDFAISQDFYFPTVYLQKKKSVKLASNQANLQMKAVEQEIIARTKKIWIEQVFLNRKLRLVSRRLEETEKLKKQYQRKFSLGEINKLEINKVSLNTSLLRNEYDKIELELHKNEYVIVELCGGQPVAINDTIFPILAKVLADSIIAAYETSPGKEFLKEQISLTRLNKTVVKGEKLPKITLGYYSENVNNESFKGIKLGLSIPLWQNHNTLKKAEAEIIYAEADLDRFENLQTSKVQQKLARRNHMHNQITELTNSLLYVDDSELLTKALMAGEISLTEYYYQSDLFFRGQVLLLEMQKEQLQLEVDILKIFEN